MAPKAATCLFFAAGIVVWLVLSSTAMAAGPSPMLLQKLDPSVPLYIIVHIDIMPKDANAAKGALATYVTESRKERGAVRVEAIQEVFANHFDLIEVWQTEAAYQTHSAGPASLDLRRRVAPWLASPWNERIGKSIAPAP